MVALLVSVAVVGSAPGSLDGRRSGDQSPLAVGLLGVAAGQIAQATDRPLGMPPGASLRRRHLAAMRLGAERPARVAEVVALAALDGLLDRPVPGTTTLDRGRTFPKAARPSGPLQLDRVGLGAGAPLVFVHHRLILGHQVRVGLAVRLVLLLGLAGGAFGRLPGDLVGLLCLLGLRTRADQVAAAQPPGRTALEAGEQGMGLLPATGRRSQLLLALLSVEPAPVSASPPAAGRSCLRSTHWRSHRHRHCAGADRHLLGHRHPAARRATAAPWREPCPAELSRSPLAHSRVDPDVDGPPGRIGGTR